MKSLFLKFAMPEFRFAEFGFGESGALQIAGRKRQAPEVGPAQVDAAEIHPVAYGVIEGIPNAGALRAHLRHQRVPLRFGRGLLRGLFLLDLIGGKQFGPEGLGPRGDGEILQLLTLQRRAPFDRHRIQAHHGLRPAIGEIQHPVLQVWGVNAVVMLVALAVEPRRSPTAAGIDRDVEVGEFPFRDVDLGRSGEVLRARRCRGEFQQIRTRRAGGGSLEVLRFLHRGRVELDPDQHRPGEIGAVQLRPREVRPR